MEQYISKSALVAEIERLAEVKPIDEFQPQVQNKIDWLSGKLFAINSLRVFLDTLEVKDANEALRTEYEKGRADVIAKACEWLKSYRQDTPDGTGYIPGIINDETIEDFKQSMEE